MTKDDIVFVWYSAVRDVPRLIALLEPAAPRD